MKVFSIDDYTLLDEECKAEIDVWLYRHGLKEDGVIRIEQFDNPEDPIECNIKLRCFGLDLRKYFRDTYNWFYVASSLEDQGERIAAEFEFDDFPWEVLDN